MSTWQERFVRYAIIVAEMEGVDFLDANDWTDEEWSEISAAVEEGWKDWTPRYERT